MFISVQFLSSHRNILLGGLMATAVTTLTVAVWSFPVVLDPARVLIGHPGDSITTLERWEQWQLSVKYMERPVVNIFGTALSRFVSPILVYNTLMLLSFVLTALCSYALFLWLTRRVGPSLIASFFFALSPYHWARSLGHIYLAHIEWIPLVALTIMVFLTRPSIGRAVLTLVSASLLVGTSFYYGFFAALLALALLVPAIVVLLLRGKQRTVAVIALTIITLLLVSLPITHSYLGWLLSGPTPRQTLLHDLLRYSARPADYFLPGGLSAARRIWNPVTTPGDFHLSNEVEQALFLGWIPLLLAALGIAGLVLDRGIPGARRQAFGWLLAMGVAAMLLSAPPVWGIGGKTLLLPSYYVSRLVPFFRSYARMGVFVHLSVCAMAALGIHVLCSRNRRNPLMVLLALLGILEFTPLPPPRACRLAPAQPVHRWLGNRQGMEILAEFPFITRRTPRTTRRAYAKHTHHRYSLDEIPTRDLRHLNTLDPHACRELARVGTDILLFHHRPPEPPLQVYKDRVGRGRGMLQPWPTLSADSPLSLRAHHPGSLVFRLDRDTPGPRFAAQNGMGRWEEGPGLRGRALAPKATITLMSTNRRPSMCSIELLIRTISPTAAWRISLNRTFVETIQQHRNTAMIRTEDLELLPGPNSLELQALGSDGEPLPATQETIAGYLLSVDIMP